MEKCDFKFLKKLCNEAKIKEFIVQNELLVDYIFSEYLTKQNEQQIVALFWHLVSLTQRVSEKKQYSIEIDGIIDVNPKKDQIFFNFLNLILTPFEQKIISVHLDNIKSNK